MTREHMFIAVAVAALSLLFVILYFAGVFSSFSNNEDLVNKLLEEKFTNRDQINEENTYENKHLFEQRVYQMLKSDNKKKYLDLSTAAKDMFLSEVNLKNI
jgi:hypothetical protein